MNIAIFNASDHSEDLLTTYTKDYFSYTSCTIQTFSEVKTLLLSAASFQLLFIITRQAHDAALTIQKELLLSSPTLPIIFVGYRRLISCQAIAPNSCGYISMPLTRPSVISALRPLFPIPKTNETLSLHCQNAVYELAVSNILYIEAKRQYSLFYVHGQEHPILTSHHLKYWEDRLYSYGFIRLMRSFLFASNAIKSISALQIVLADGRKLPCTKAALEQYDCLFPETSYPLSIISTVL